MDFWIHSQDMDFWIHSQDMDFWIHSLHESWDMCVNLSGDWQD
jgi:hypothetical protein